MFNKVLKVIVPISLLSGCLLRTDDFVSEAELKREVNELATIKREYINVNSWGVSDTDKAVAEIVEKFEKSDNFQKLVKTKHGKVKIKVGSFKDNTKEEGFPIIDIKNELIATLGQNPNITLIDNGKDDVLLDEIAYQNDGAVRQSDIKKIGNQEGADLLLFGNVNMSKTMEIDTLTKNYYLSIKMTNIETAVNAFTSVYKVRKKYTVE